MMKGLSRGEVRIGFSLHRQGAQDAKRDGLAAILTLRSLRRGGEFEVLNGYEGSINPKDQR